MRFHDPSSAASYLSPSNGISGLRRHMKAPIARSISWPLLALSITPLVLLLVLNSWLLPQWFPIFGAFFWLGLVWINRWLFTHSHRKGMQLVKNGRFADAIPHFIDAYTQMSRRPWVDRNRALVLGSASRWSYREMALCNQAFCLGQIGEGRKMRETYERVLREFPESVLATTALRMVDAISQS